MKNKIHLIADREEILSGYTIANLGEDKYILIGEQTFGPYKLIDKLEGTSLLVCKSCDWVELVNSNGILVRAGIAEETMNILEYIENNLKDILSTCKPEYTVNNYSVDTEDTKVQGWKVVNIQVKREQYSGLWDASLEKCYIKPDKIIIDIEDTHIVCLSANSSDCYGYVYDHNFNKILQGKYKDIRKICTGLWEVKDYKGDMQLIKIENGAAEALTIPGQYRYYSELNSNYGLLRGGWDNKAEYRLVYKKEGRLGILVGLNVDNIYTIGKEELEVIIGNIIYNTERGEIRYRGV